MKIDWRLRLVVCLRNGKSYFLNVFFISKDIAMCTVRGAGKIQNRFFFFLDGTLSGRGSRGKGMATTTRT